MMLKNILTDAARWAKSGFAIAKTETIKERLEKCSGCEFWDKKSYGGSGKCLVCGCSTKAKLALATSKCPKQKW